MDIVAENNSHSIRWGREKSEVGVIGIGWRGPSYPSPPNGLLGKVDLPMFYTSLLVGTTAIIIIIKKTLFSFFN